MNTPARTALVAAVALAAALLQTACGGGDPAAAAATVRVESAARVAPSAPRDAIQVEGCIVDVVGRPMSLAIHATGADGRLLASTISGIDGNFRVRLPVGRVVRLDAAVPGVEPLTLLTGEHDLAFGGCLRQLA